METVRLYGNPPYHIALIHGGPGAAGDMKPVAEELSSGFGIIEPLQTGTSVNALIEELHDQLMANGKMPFTLVGHSWGAWLSFLFTARYAYMVGKLILISAGAFENKYNPDIMGIRFGRLKPEMRKEAENLAHLVNTGSPGETDLKRFGELIAMADSYDPFPEDQNPLSFDPEIMRAVWAEAAELRNTDKLINTSDRVICPVVAIHGDHDPHPAKGVEIPLSERMEDFKMIVIEKCGHTPWKERQARKPFYEILRQELM